jgi:hypothetical protein
MAFLKHSMGMLPTSPSLVGMQIFDLVEILPEQATTPDFMLQSGSSVSLSFCCVIDIDFFFMCADKVGD